MAAPRSSLIPATSTPDAGSSKGAHAGPSKGGIAGTANTGPHNYVESTAQAIGFYISIPYAGPSAFPSYSPMTRLHRHPVSKGDAFAAVSIACTADRSPSTGANCPSHSLSGTGTCFTCTVCRNPSVPG